MFQVSLAFWSYDRNRKKVCADENGGIRDVITERTMMLSKIIKRKTEMFAYFERKSGSPGRTEQTLSASGLNSLRAKLPSYLPSCSL